MKVGTLSTSLDPCRISIPIDLHSAKKHSLEFLSLCHICKTMVYYCWLKTPNANRQAEHCGITGCKMIARERFNANPLPIIKPKNEVESDVKS